MNQGYLTLFSNPVIYGIASLWQLLHIYPGILSYFIQNMEFLKIKKCAYQSIVFLPQGVVLGQVILNNTYLLKEISSLHKSPFLNKFKAHLFKNKLAFLTL